MRRYKRIQVENQRIEEERLQKEREEEEAALAALIQTPDKANEGN